MVQKTSLKTTAIQTPSDDNHTVVLRQLKEVAETGQRLRGDPSDSFVRVSELVQAGIMRLVNGTLQPPTTGSLPGAAVPSTRSVGTSGSLVGGGTLAADLTLQLAGDSATPGNSQLYGTNASGAKGWYAQPGSASVSPLTTKGDIWVFGTLNTRLPVGSNTQVLTADSTQTTGLKWAAPSTTLPVTTKGDLLGFDTAANRIPIGTDGFALVADSSKALGLKWSAVASGGGSADIQVFTPGTSTWTKPAGAKAIEVILIGGGGGGGSGRKGATSTIRCGGGSGGGAGMSRFFMPASVLGATETVIAGAGGTGGAAQTVNSTNGSDGVDGGTSSFGGYMKATGGGHGGAGTAVSGPLGVAGLGLVSDGGIGAAGSGNGTATIPGNSKYGGAGGGCGYGLPAVNTGGFGTPNVDADGATGPTMNFTSLAGGAAGAALGSNGSNGNNAVGYAPGSGGGGGAANTSATVNAGNGGNGGLYGAGGAGGGAATNGTGNSGKGGTGGDGVVVVITYF